MANLYDSDSRKRDTVIRIPRFEIGEHYTVYTIEFALGPFKWSVNRRFSEFANLHDELCNRHKLRDVELPAKKIFGNQSYSFVQRRQKELEEYLRRLFQIFPRPPPPLSRFTLWDKYEVHGITATMSAYVLGMGVTTNTTGSNDVNSGTSQSPATPSGLGAGGIVAINQDWRQRLPFEFSVLQVHAINARIDSPAPTNDLDHMKYDVGHIMNFVTHLPSVRVWGSTGYFGTSNIVMNQLKYDLSVFKQLESLELIRVDLSHLKGVDQLKRTLTKVVIHFTLQTLKELLLQDLMDCNLGQDSTMVQCWSRVREADFSDNSLRSIDESIKLLPNVQKLNLSGNQIPTIANLEHLSELQRLNLSRNGITDLINLNAKLGNIKELILVENRLTSLLGLSRVYSLQTLDVTKNQISEIIEVCHIGRLPCLENLCLTDNPVTLIPDYRTKVFEQFGERSPELRLDGKRGTQKELDTAAVLQAIQRAREHRSSIDMGTRAAGAAPGAGAGAGVGVAGSVPVNATGRHNRRIGSPSGPSSASPRARPTQLVPPRDPAVGRGANGGGSGIARSASPGSEPPEGLDRRRMEALKSRGGKQWLVEYNQMLDEHELARGRRQEAVETARVTLSGAPSVSDVSADEDGDARAPEPVDVPDAPAEAAAEALEGSPAPAGPWPAADRASDRLEARVEQALARLLHLYAAPDLAALAPALPLLGGASEEADEPGPVPGGAVAVTADGRVLVLARPARGRRGAGEAPFDDATGLSLALHMEAANLAQVVRGHRGLYLRLEERFASGPDGLAVLLTARARDTDRLADAVSALSGLSVVSVERVRRRQLEEFAAREEASAAPEPVQFYAVALFQSGGLRQLVSALVSRRRLHLLDEAFFAQPPPLFAAHGRPEESTDGFRSLGAFSRRQLCLDAAQVYAASAGAEVLPEDDFFRHRVRVPLAPEARRSLHELSLGFQTARLAADFVTALAALQEERPADADGPKPAPVPAPMPVEPARRLAFERWDALSAAVKHRVASADAARCPLRRLLDMDSGQLAHFFERHVRPAQSADAEGEELVAVMWTYWLHYRSRQQEALACAFLTSLCVHVVFDDWAAPGADGATDPTLAFKSLMRRAGPDVEPAPGPGETRAGGGDGAWSVRVFALPLRSLVTVFVGPFNQYVRLSGDARDRDCTLVTRDFRLTENLLNYLRAVFRGRPLPDLMDSEAATPGQGPALGEEELLVYRPSARPASVERLGPGAGAGWVEDGPGQTAAARRGVEVRFPSDEVLSEMMFVVEEAVAASGGGPASRTLSSSPHGALLDSLNLLYYLLLEHLSIDFVEYVTCAAGDHLMSVLLLTDDYLVILRQNISQYPIPDFERGPPELAQFAVLDVRRLRCLTHLTLNSCDRRLLVLNFAPLPPTPAAAVMPRPGPRHGSIDAMHSATAASLVVSASLPLSHSADDLAARVPPSPGLTGPPEAMSSSTAALDATAAPASASSVPGYRTMSSLTPPGDPVQISAYIQNPRDVDKLVKLIRAAWREFYPGLDLPVHRS